MTEFMEKLMKTILTGGSSINSAWLQFNAEFGGSYSGLGTFIKNAWNYLALIGVGMTLIYFLIEMNQKLAIEGSQNMTMKSLMAPFLKLMIAIVILCNGSKITMGLLSINDTFVAHFNGTTISSSSSSTPSTPSTSTTSTSTDPDTAGMDASSAEVYVKMRDAMADLGMVQAVIFCLILLLAYLVSLVLMLVWMYKAVSYKLEVLFRVAITPIALADVYSGSHSNAFRWLKGFLALALYAVAIIILPKIATLLGASLLTTGLGSGAGLWDLTRALFTLFVAPFAALGVASTVKQMCKEALA